ncbi:BspA family leucine-rich repeat surface protein [Portibacter lacus]|uniref:BspA family leucine-rich repeat surface protein n=1 Tax=Portibacter lacus TaxID=1099794 RepID=A0AA37SUP3_9BACT|nr:BspA family leucine-rich repeat surface protein [Portibacter lacus]GLR18528.1 hypothetical protein GCM10007940_31440 [Portibacter lacus]
MTCTIENLGRVFLLYLFVFLSNHTFAQDLLMVWKTDNPGYSDDNSVEIPTYPSLSYYYDIDWENDGTFDITGVTGSIKHTYSSPGTYTIRIRGIFPGICFNNVPYSDKDKILDITQFGSIVWERMDFAFYGCSNFQITAGDTPNMSNVQSMRWAFANTNVFNTDISAWDVSNVEDMSFMFYNAIAFNSPLNWSNKTSKVKEMWRMFQNATAFNQDISAWDYSEVENMNNMLDLSGLSIEMYDLLLISLASQNVKSNVTFGAEGLTYCNGEVARDFLISQHGWTFVGDSKGTSNLRWTGEGNDGNWSNALNWEYNMLPCDCNIVQLEQTSSPINISNQVKVLNLSLENETELVVKTGGSLILEEN